MRHTRGAGSEVNANGLIRRQRMTTWGILALALFVSVGMAEWSKRSAMGEKVVSAQVLERALTIAEKMEDRRWEIGNHPFSISQAPTVWLSESAAKIQSTLGVEK